jgi:peptidyl-prolyl cis-trans isomerase D
MAVRKGISKTFVWILLGLLIVGLAGFGATNLSGTVRTVGSAGDETISVDDYARELQREIRAVEAQTGQALPMDRVRAMNLDQVVLGRLVSLAALDNETAQLGLSIGDANLQEEIVAIEAFQGLDGGFDRESYRFALQQAGLNEAAFEEDLRNEAARTLVQAAIIGGTEMPDAFAEIIVDYVGARRSFTWARLDDADLSAPLPAATEAELQSYYDENTADFTLPETKDITYAVLTPDMLVDSVEVDEAALRGLYDERSSQYSQPERRLVERLVFADESAAEDALAQLSVGGTTFELLVEQRGLSLADVDLGDVRATELGAAAEPVFGAEPGDVVGPVQTDLGPALFRVNGVLNAQETAFEDVADDLRAELAADRARRLVEAQAQNIDDLLAGGATLEELAAETDLELGQIGWTEGASDGIAAYAGFRDSATAATTDDFPAVDYLEDGSIFALRVNEVLPPRPEPFESARPRVEAAWRTQETQRMLEDQVAALVPELAASGDFAAAGLVPNAETDLTRTAFIDGAPRALLTEVFAMTEGDVSVVPASGAVYVVRLDGLSPPEAGGEAEQLRGALQAELDQSLAQNLFDAFVRDAQVRAAPQIDRRALDAVLSSFQ